MYVYALKFTKYCIRPMDFAVFVLSLLTYFEWSHTAIIYDTHNPLMRIQGDSLVLALRDDHTKWRPYPLSFDARLEVDHERMLLDASKYARGVKIIAQKYL